MAQRIIWLVIMLPACISFTGLGVFAWRRKKPMWFWSGSVVREDEISDIPAYNRANGIMWIAYSLVFWASAVLGWFRTELAGIVLAVGCLGGIPLLIIAYKKIYAKYRVKRQR